MKASRRTKTLAIVWVVATAIMAILTDQNDWSITPLAIISASLLIIVSVSVFIDNFGYLTN